MQVWTINRQCYNEEIIEVSFYVFIIVIIIINWIIKSCLIFSGEKITTGSVSLGI